MEYRRIARPTLTAIELHCGEAVHFERADGGIVRIEARATGAHILRTTLRRLRHEEEGARTDYAFYAVLRVNGREHVLDREISTPRSFYEPWNIEGVHIWLDTVDDIFEFLAETHGPCRPRKRVRLALQDAHLGIAPESLHPWCPLPPGGLRIEDCYRGENCWLGAYNGASAHGGLDINHPRGTPLWAPVDIDDHELFNSLRAGHTNNRWRGIHRWPDGSTWILQAHHMTALTMPEHQPIPKGTQFAVGAGVHSGAVDHSHFVFQIMDEYGRVMLDPWILFASMYRDQQGPLAT